jgi:single-strand DNA-binding protein
MSTFAETVRLTADPELRFTPDGKPVVQIRFAINSGYYDRNRQWVDNEPTFLDGEYWRGAENAAESLSKGHEVIVRGNLRTRSWDREDGTRGSKTYVEITDIGPSLAHQTAKVTKVRRDQSAAE